MKKAGLKRRSPVGVSQRLDVGEEDMKRATELGLDRNQDRETVLQSNAPRMTVNELLRQKTDSTGPHQHSITGGVDGPSLVTHLPDIVVQSDHHRPLPFRVAKQAVVLFLDISGFTALCEKYSQAAKTGTEQLTKTLNGYMSALVSEIISYDGDILKFAGDAILSMWPVESLFLMSLAVENVITCALEIQRKHGTYTTNDGVTLKVKIGIAAGEVEILIIGNDDERTYIEVGRGIEDVNKAENMCEKGGDVIVAPSAWIHCYDITTTHVQMHDTKFIKVTGIQPRSSTGYRTERTIPVTAEMENLDRSIRNLIIPEKMLQHQDSSEVVEWPDSDSPDELHDEDQRHVPLSIGANMRRLRKTIITHFSRDKVHNLKLFISKPVLRKIEDHQPLEYLSEMRQVTMLFINLDVDRSTKYGYLLLMQRCHEVIFAKAKRMRGCISKIFAFDKGCTFMVIFGLPGYKHENDSAHALGCAYEIYTELNEIVGLIQTSIGVTTGPTYCGIVGHNHRHEYTVIGRRVNMGARLMMHYRGKVICDNTTFYYSKLNETYFIVQEAKEMKGLQQVGTVREYRPLINLKDEMDQIRVQQEQKPIIGRDDELANFENCLDRLVSSTGKRTPVVMVLGEIGMGRTRLMNAFLAASIRRSITVVLCALSIGNVNFSYYVVRTLLLQLIKCDKVAKETRMKLLIETFSKNMMLMDNINFLDALLETDTERKTEFASSELMMEIVRQVVRHYAGRFTAIIFAVDDTHLMDDYSWKCMPIFAENTNTMLVMTRRVLLDQSIKNETAVAFLRNPDNLVVHCSGLSVFHLASIACQFLNVVRIPDSLDHVLRLNSMGIPSWIDLLLREYLYEAVIKIEPTMIVNNTETMVVPAPKDLMEKEADEKPVVGDIADNVLGTFVDELKLDSMSPNAELVCFMLIQQTDDLKVPTSIASMIQARIDHMQEVDQTVLKSASIIGQFVFREILQHLVQLEVTKADLGESIQRLADSGAFACASSMKTSRGRAGVAGMGGAFTGQTCICHGVQDERAMRDCRVLMFLSASLRMTAYEMMLEQNRRPLHMSAAHFLEEKIRLLSTKTMNESSLYESYLYGEEEKEKHDDDDVVENVVISELIQSPEEPNTEEMKDGKRKSSRLTRVSSGYRFTRQLGSKRVSAASKPHATRLKTIIGVDMSAKSDAASLAVSEFIKKHIQTSDRHSAAKSWQTSSAAMAEDLAGMSDSVQVNYTGFERLGVLRIQYPQIADQYRGAGNTQNTVFYSIEAAAACLALFDYHGAIIYLREASRIFRDLKYERNPFEGRVATLDNWTPEPYDEGNMESLIGQTLFSMEKPKKAVPHFHRALKLLECEQAISTIRMKVAAVMERSKFGKYHEKIPGSEARILSGQAICLFYIFEDCIARNDLVGARYAAFQQVTKTERSGDLIGQIEAATCMLKLAHLTNDLPRIREYENKAKVKCIVAMQNVRNDQVIRLTRMYWAAFEVHIARDPINEAVESGLSATRMMTAIRGSGITHVHMLASLANALMYADRIKDAADVLDMMQGDSSRGESRCWYYYCCLQMVLTLGVRQALVEDCLSYSDEIISQRLFVKRPQLLFCFACSLCLYYRRIRAEERFEEWRKVAVKNEPTRYDSFITVVAFFDLLECKLLQLSRIIGEIRRAVAIRQQGLRRSFERTHQAEKRYLERAISRDLSFGQHVVNQLVALHPRYLMLEAYHAAINDRSKAAYNQIRTCIQRATALKIINHARWAKHNQAVWYSESSADIEKTAGAGAGGGTGEVEDELPFHRSSLLAGTGLRRSTIFNRRSVTGVFDHRTSATEQPQPGQARRRSSQRQNMSIFLNDRGVSAHSGKSISTAVLTGADPSELQDQWLRSAESSFPSWYILNQIRGEARLFLHFSLPLPHWFAARMF